MSLAPHLTLRTLTRGDGLLGLRPRGPLGPRGDQVTVALLSGGDARAEQTLASLGLVPLDPGLLQWRGSAQRLGESLWTLVQEDFFGDFHAERVPELQAQGDVHQPLEGRASIAQSEGHAGVAIHPARGQESRFFDVLHRHLDLVVF